MNAYGLWDASSVQVVVSALVLLMLTIGPIVLYNSVNTLTIVRSSLTEWARTTASSAHCSSTTGVEVTFFDQSWQRLNRVP